MRWRGVLLLVLAGMPLLGACQPPSAVPTPTAAPTDSPSHTPSPTRPPSPTATPETVVTILEISLIQPMPGGEWQLIGLLENRASYAIGDVALRLTMRAATGGKLERATAPASLTAIPPGGQSPFSFELQRPPELDTMELDVQSWVQVDYAAPSLSVETLREVPSDGGAEILGLVANQGQSPAALVDLFLVSRNAGGELNGFGRLSAGPAILPPGEKIPFRADLASEQDTDELLAFPDARTVDHRQAEPSAVLIGEPALRQDPQGNPHLIGEVTNQSQARTWESALFGLRLGPDWLLVLKIMDPLPLDPGERRAFLSDDLPGLQAMLAQRDADLGSVQVEAWIDPPSADRPVPQAAPLEVEIRSYEMIGSSIFMRGVISNSGDAEVFRPTVHCTIWTTGGELVSAGWNTPQASLEPGEGVQFILWMPQPEGADPTYFEPNVWAAGLAEPPPSMRG